jgi:hypothetical protein
MKVLLRPLDTEDLQGFARLRSLVYARYNHSVWRWLGSHSLANEMRRWVLVAEDHEIVGHLAAVAQFYRISGQRVVAYTPADYMVLPGYGFHALSLMREFFRTCENCVSCDQVQEAIKVERRLGAEEVGVLHYAAKLLDISKLTRLPASIPAPIPKVLNRGLRVVDKTLALSFGGDLAVEVIERFDESFDKLFANVAAVVPCLAEKDAAFLHWRYGPNSPQAPVTVLGVRDSNDLLGYAVLRLTNTGPRYAYLLDLTTLPGRYDVSGALLREAVERGARAEARGIRYQFLESPTSPPSKHLRRLGFYREKNPNTLLVNFSDPSLHEIARNPAHWSYNAGDGEASFWVG